MEIETIQLLESYDSNIQELNIGSKNIKGLLDLSKFTNLENLICCNNKITKIVNYPESLKSLKCNDNNLTSLDNLTCKIQFLYCDFNEITNLDNLPNSLIFLTCVNNKITSLDYLPENLQFLMCVDNPIKSLDMLPRNIKKVIAKSIDFDFKFCCSLIKAIIIEIPNLIYSNFKIGIINTFYFFYNFCYNKIKLFL